MHGVKRVRAGQRDPEDVAKAKAAREQARIHEYMALRSQLSSMRANDIFTQEALDLTSRVLEKNPEYPTGWAYRRRILKKGLFAERSEQDTQTLLEQDLDLTAQCLKRNPKDYSVWEHRKWVLRTMPDPDWRYELKTTEALLERDARNYHAWDYRRYLIASIHNAPAPPSYSTRKRPAPSTSSELAYTSNKISASFSNFSAWHYRSKLLQKLWADESQDSSSSKHQMLLAEFELVKQALYTDPDDQSAWIYHRWLVSQGGDEDLEREAQVIEELTELEPDSKWCLESLVFYGQELARKKSQASSALQTSQLTLKRLEKLQEVDPLRSNRYRDLSDGLSRDLSSNEV